jgi:TolA-binding protein
MSAPELHADDLLDKEARGELTAAERARLDHHVAMCSVCRFERQVRDDFRLEFETMGQADRRLANGSGARRGRRTSRARWLLLAAAAMLVTGAAAAEFETIRHTILQLPLVSRPVATAPAEPAAHDTRTVAKGIAPTAPETPAPVEAPAPIAPAEAPAPPIAAPADVPAPTVASRPAAARPAPPPAATPTIEASEEPVPPAPVAAPPADTEATLFAAANDARQRGAYAEAIRSYRELTQRFPQSREATTAHLILGKLLLDRGDPSSALDQFDVYLASGAMTLGEEAMVGRAQALERLGRSTEEAAAWTALLDGYPQSVHAARARTRLASLGNR